MTAIHLVVLNYNGRHLLKECLPSVMAATRASRYVCQVAVIDNNSWDDSLAFLRSEYPAVQRFHCSNRGLCSYNDVLARLDSPVVVLLNNDIKLATSSIDPLVEPLLPQTNVDGCFLTAPLCWLFDGETYEGLQTAIRWRWGLVQAVSDYPGHERVMRGECRTASAGAVMAVDRRKFLELGGFDPLYLPGRLEDLDFAFRGYMAGYHAKYVPRSVAYHKGEATFRQELGGGRSQALALRNTLLFQWKNLQHPWHVLRHATAVPARLVWDLVRVPFMPPGKRWEFCKALVSAIHRWRQRDAGACLPHRCWRRERDFIAGFDWRRFASARRRLNRRKPVGNALRGVPGGVS
jgi:N-acetylglucosaminyl-diphospho-decaprenol L-rhamnosyltransferase